MTPQRQSAGTDKRMKPNFALSLTHEGISLLHRAPGGWHLVGEAGLDAPNLSETLGFLRQTAVGLDNIGVQTKLIIPNSQILYTELDAPGPQEKDRISQIRKALDGATPYPVSDLVFDWHTIGDRVQVAAVARETLAEAESFAAENRFNPLCFVAVPDEGQFTGEPFFGVTRVSRQLLDGEEVVERDAFAVKVVPLPESVATFDAAPETEGALPDHADESVNQPAPDDALQTQPVATDRYVTQTPEDPEEEPAIKPTAASDAQQAARSGKDNSPQTETPVSTADGDADNETGTETGQNAARTTERALRSGATPRQPEPSDNTGAPESAEHPDLAPAFSSRRADSLPSDDTGEEPLVLPQARLAVLPGETKSDAPIIGAAVPAVAVVTTPDTPDLPLPAAGESPPGSEEPAGQDHEMAAPGLPDPVHVAQSLAPSAERPGTGSNMPGHETAAGSENAQGFTVFGARKIQDASGGRPAYLALVFTLSTLVILALLTLWFTFAPGEGPGAQFRPGETAPAAAGQSGTDSAIASPQQPATAAGSGRAPVPADAVADSSNESAPPAPFASMTREVAQAFYNETGIWQRSPQSPNILPEGNLKNLYIASLDPQVGSFDAIALPAYDPSPEDGKLAQQFDPAPAGTSYDLDDNGFVVPTAEGALNADGIPVFAGPPARTSEPRPRNAAFPAQEQSPAETARLAGFRPRPRPANLLEQYERTLFGGLTRAQLAAKRPPRRPVGPQGGPESDMSPTELAVAQSRAPTGRPSNFASVVRTARANAAAASAAAAATAVAANTANATPRASAPAAASPAPTIPTRASVARQATVTNAINLRSIALIGVYGSSSSRRALVRLRNGRYVKVEIGDRVDGGQVAAIGERQLQYVKGGRNITLHMPEL